MAADFAAGYVGPDADITMHLLVSPFGVLASPIPYQLFADPVALHHANLRPINPEWIGRDNFRQVTFVDDSMLIEPRIGNRPEINVDCWEFCLKRRAGESSVNQDKLT